MSDKNIDKTKRADRRRKRVRGKIFGTATRPRLSVAKSLNNVFVQIIDDEKHVTLVACASNSSAVKGEVTKEMNKSAVANKVGKIVAALAKEKGIEVVVFDRNKNRFHGRIKAFADGAREGGLKF